MKMLKFLALISCLLVPVLAQVNVQQAPGAYTNNSVPVRDGTTYKIKNSNLLYSSNILTLADNTSSDTAILLNASPTGFARVRFDQGGGRWMQFDYINDLFTFQGRNTDAFNIFTYNNTGAGFAPGYFYLQKPLLAANGITVGTLSNSAFGNAINFDNDYNIGWEANPAGTDLTLGVNSSNILVSTAPFSAPTITSTVATGTAPFTVASTTQVANLNAATAGTATSATTATNAVNIGITDDTSTNATMYPLWATAATGNLPAKVSSTKLNYNPSTGLLSTTAVAIGTGSSVAGTVTMGEGTAPSLTANAFSIYSPTDVAAGGLAYVLPGAASTGAMIATNSAGVMTVSHVAPGTSGNVLTSNGTTWTSAAPAGGSVAGSDTQIQYNNSGAFGANAGLTVNKTSGAVTQTQTSLGTSSVFGYLATNTTAAAAGAQQVSPSVRWTGQGWKTDATAASQAVDFMAYVLPVQGTANPSGTWQLQSSINGGAFTNRLTVTSGGTLTVSGAGIFGAGMDVTGSYTTSAAGGGFAAGSSGGFNWGGTKSYIKSSADGAIEITNFAATANATVKMATLVSAKASTPYTVLATDSRTLFTNEGASAQITFNLPTAVANYSYTFYVQDTDGVLIVASSGDTIRFGATVTATGGDISSTTVGSSITLTAINATEWVATSLVGTWAD